ncbi:hypothetical protein BDV23DRAFT_189139 [Aspergillus alliaceus]|uniref:Cytochrome P450 n=1 Tax=Petromyces alliaceus TaxID=209559 RepID=A0A5N7BRQ8_PETAA|nr:hypothetical protein BDV23DRAFT_189139 [Aspergillus alliaceus]
MFLVVNLVLFLTDLYLLQCARKERKILKRLPPGPTPKPIIGSNLLDLPPPGAPEWLHWLKHKELYGKATIQIAKYEDAPANQLSNDLWSIIIANGHRAVIDLMEKSSGSKISTQLFSWLRLAEKDKAYKKRAKAMTDILYAFVKQQLARQKHIPSYVSRLPKRDQVEPGSEEKLVAKRPAQSIYGGGAETKKAQEEIDRVVEPIVYRIYPIVTNSHNINVVVKDVLQWHPVTPTGVAHASSKEDIYHGYLIPKGGDLGPQ